MSHIQINHEGLRYECHECDVVFTSAAGVRKHVKSVHKQLKYDCDMCDVKLSQCTKRGSTKKQKFMDQRL